MKRLFRKEDITLLQDSLIIQTYPQLRDLLIASPDIMDTDIHTLADDLQLVVRYERSRIIGIAQAEWADLLEEGYEAIEVGQSVEHTRCELCGATSCKDLFPIGNYDKSKVIYIGRECIKRFVPRSSQSIARYVKLRTELRRYARLTEYFPGIYEQFIAIKSSVAANPEYLVSDPLYSECQKCFRTIRDLCAEHQNAEEHELPAINHRLKAELAHYNELSQRVQQYLLDAPNNWKIPTRAMVNRDKQFNRSRGIQQVRKEGCITAKTLGFFDEPRFLQDRMVPLVKTLLQSTPLSIIRTAEINGIGSYLVEIKANHVLLYIRHIDLASLFGVYLISGHPTQKTETLLMLCKITENTSIDKLLTTCLPVLKPLGGSLIGYERDMDELYIRIGTSYYVIPLISTLQKYMPFFIAPDAFPLKGMHPLLGDRANMITQQEWQRRLHPTKDDYVRREIITL